jgi:hypothetical protein
MPQSIFHKSTFFVPFFYSQFTQAPSRHFLTISTRKYYVKKCFECHGMPLSFILDFISRLTSFYFSHCYRWNKNWVRKSKTRMRFFWDSDILVYWEVKKSPLIAIISESVEFFKFEWEWNNGKMVTWMGYLTIWNDQGGYRASVDP